MARVRRLNDFLRGLNRLFVFAVTTILGIYAFIVLADGVIGSRLFDGWVGAAVFVAALATGWIPAVFIHELGHALAAQALGWRVWLFSVGPWIWRVHPRMSVDFGSPLSIDVGGFVLPTPRTEAVNTRWRDALISAAGPAVSIAAALIAYKLALALEADYGADRLVSSLLFAFSVSSWGAAMLTLWPAQFGQRGNDIIQVWQKLRATKYRPSAFVYGDALKRYGVKTPDFDAWIREPVMAAEERRTVLAANFFAAIEANDVHRANAVLGDGQDDERNIMRAYLAALEGDVKTAELTLIKTSAAARDWEAGSRLRDLAFAAIQTTAGEYASAAHRLNRIEKAAKLDMPRQPIWIMLIERARAALPVQAGPWSSAQQSA